MTTQELKILAEPTLVPENCKFILDRPIVEGPSVRFTNTSQTKGSALAEFLFNVGSIQGLLIAGNSIVVTQNGNEDWRVLGKKIGAAIRDAYASGKTLIDRELLKDEGTNNNLKEKVQEILEKEINPAIASHGGFIEILDVRHNDLYIKMGGGCQGCASSKATLRSGVEQSLRRAIPELGAIYDTTDHAAGQNPYYSA